MSFYELIKHWEACLRKRFKPKRRSIWYERHPGRFKKRYPQYEIGVGTYISVPTVYDFKQNRTLRIGSYCSIAGNVEIFLGGHHRLDWITTYPFSCNMDDVEPIPDSVISKGDVIIGSDVWVCAGAVILSGVTIGHGAVIANSAVVSRDVEPYAIVAGNPAQVVRYRFDEPVRKKLLEIAWWEWPVEEVKSIYKLLNQGDVQVLFDYAERRQQ